MNILFLTSYLPYAPITGAYSRLYNIIKQARKKHHVTLLSFIKESDQEHLTKAEQTVDKLYTVKLKKSNKSKLGAAVNEILGLPLFLTYYWSDEYKDRLREIVDRDRIDLVHVDQLYMASYIPFISAKKVIDLLDCETVRLKTIAAKTASYKQKALAEIQIYKIKNNQKKYLRQCDRVLTISNVDEKIIKGETGLDNIETFEMGVDTDYFNHREYPEAAGGLLFTGLMNYPPNVDAVIYFNKMILPHIRNVFPEIEVNIVGKNPAESIIELGEQNKGINVTGFVDDVRPYFNKAQVFICPIRSGSGVRVKLLEAMSMGKAIVTTSTGVEGINAKDGEELLIADSPEDFAGKVIMLLKDDKLREKLGRAARKFVESKYSWDKRGEQILNIYDQIMKTDKI